MNGIALNTRFETSAAARGHRSLPGGLLPSELRLKSLVAATALALAVLPDVSFGQSIGPLDVRSRLGERFFAAVPVRTRDGIIDPGCIRVAPNPNAPAGAQPLQAARIRVGSADTVIIETVGTVMSPVVGLRLEVGCENPVSRDFVVLDPSVSQSALPVTRALPASVPSTAAAPVGESAPRTAETRPQRRAAQVPQPTRAMKPAAAAAKAPLRAASAPPPDARAATTARSAPPAAATAASSAGTEVSTATTLSPDSQRRISELRARSDDHAAAMLALEDRLALLQKQTELIKAQLERRLAAMPDASGATASIPSTPAAAATAAAAPAAPTTATPIAAVPAPVAASPASPTAQANPSSSAASSAPQAVPTTSNARGQSVLDLLLDWKVAGGIGVLLLGAFALSRRRRPTFEPEPATPASTLAQPGAMLDETPAHLRTQEVPVLARAVRAADTAEWDTTRPAMVDQTAEWVAPPTTDSLPLPDAVATQPATLPGAAMTREFHITQQFQPAAERVVALSSPEEIVQQARTHYMEDNDVFKAIDLLEMAVSARKDSTRPWQALFAIYRRENMPERYQRLVLAYRGAFGQDDNWPAIRTLGHQIDRTNALYGDDGGDEAIPDDLVERWLGVPLDFTAHLLANEMHDQLMDTYSGRKRRNRR
jgi:hypothetical protein